MALVAIAAANVHNMQRHSPPPLAPLAQRKPIPPPPLNHCSFSNRCLNPPPPPTTATCRQLKQASSIDGSGRDLDAADLMAHNMLEFLPLDDLPEDNNLAMKEGEEAQVVPRVPLSLVPLSDAEKASDTALVGGRAGRSASWRIVLLIACRSRTPPNPTHPPTYTLRQTTPSLWPSYHLVEPSIYIPSHCHHCRVNRLHYNLTTSSRHNPD